MCAYVFLIIIEKNGGYTAMYENAYGEGIGFIADEMELEDETEPVSYHSCEFNTKSACTRLITPSFDSIPDAVPSIRKIEPEAAHFGA